MNRSIASNILGSHRAYLLMKLADFSNLNETLIIRHAVDQLLVTHYQSSLLVDTQIQPKHKVEIGRSLQW